MRHTHCNAKKDLSGVIFYSVLSERRLQHVGYEKPQKYRGPGTRSSCEAERRSMSGNVCEAMDELTWKEPDGDWGLSTIEAFCKQHMERL